MGKLNIKKSELSNMIMQGFKTEDIASALKMSQGGVKFHITKFYKSNGVKNRAEYISKMYKSEVERLRVQVLEQAATIELLRST